MRRASIDRVNAKYGGRGGTVVGSAFPVAAPAVVRGPVGIQGGLVQGINRSTVIGAPVYQTVEHPPVYEAVTTPPRVYEIVTPIVEVTEGAVQQQNYQVDQERLYAKSRRSSGCPWWCLLLLGLLFLGLLLSVLGYIFRSELGLAAAGAEQNDENAGGEAGEAKTGGAVTGGEGASEQSNNNEKDQKTGHHHMRYYYL